MKKSKFILICITCFLLNSCNYLFNPPEYYLSDIKTEQELVLAVNAVNDYFLVYLNENSHQNSEIFGDDLFFVLDNSDPIGPVSPVLYNGYYSLSNGIRGNESFKVAVYDWRWAYKIITSINNILSQFDLNSIEGRKTEELLGELVFLRAYLHYRLILVYGGIPIVENNEVNYTISKSTNKEVYEFIEAELLKAMNMLPYKNTLSRIPYETTDRGCAKALLGEVYLSWAGYPVNDASKYTLSAKITEEIIDSASFYNYELLPDFEDLWNNKRPYNNEVIFCKYIDPKIINWPRYRGNCTHTSYPRGGGFGYDGKVRITFVNGYPAPEIQFYNNYPKNFRKDITFFTCIYVDPVSIGIDTKHPLPGLDTGYFNIEKTDLKSRAGYRKFFIDTSFLSKGIFEDAGDNYSGSSRIYLIRYAQTLLTYAEAMARSGNLNAEAYECVNMVRRRANKLPLNEPSSYDLPLGLSAEAFADSVVQERAWELAGEPGHRWFDMVRTQTVEKVFEKRDPNDGGPFEYSANDKYFFPLPEGDINLNPKLGE